MNWVCSGFANGDVGIAAPDLRPPAGRKNSACGPEIASQGVALEALGRRPIVSHTQTLEITDDLLIKGNV